MATEGGEFADSGRETGCNHLRLRVDGGGGGRVVAPDGGSERGVSQRGGGGRCCHARDVLRDYHSETSHVFPVFHARREGK